MKKMIALVCAGCLFCGCASASPLPEANEEFTAFLDDYVRETCEHNYMTLHQFYENPEDAGIDPSDVIVTLGPVSETDADTEALIGSLKERLDSFDRDSLDGVQRTIYDDLQFDFKTYEDSDKEEFKYLDQIWSEYDSPVNDLVMVFGEYDLYDEAGIKPLTELIEDVPRYMDDCFAYTKEQAKEGLLMMDLEAVTDKCEEVLDTSGSDVVRENLHGEIEALGLDEKKTDEYIGQVDAALDENFYPVIREVPDRLGAFKDENRKVTGLANLPHGKDYYGVLLRNSISCEDGPDEVRDNLEAGVSALSLQVQSVLRQYPDALDEAFTLDTGFEDPEEILDWLADNYQKAWPAVKKMEYELEPLEASQSNEGTAAYFMIPPIDNTGKYKIRYNPDLVGEDAGSVSTFMTMAHEGITGHMYENQYDREHFEYPVQYMMQFLGYAEGYATYVEDQMAALLDDSEAMMIYRANETLSNYYVGLMDLDVNYYGLSRKEFKEKYGELFGESAVESLYDQLAWMPTTFLAYYYGGWKLADLRNEARKKLGDDFSAVDFNNAVLMSGQTTFETVEKNVEDWMERVK